MLQLPLSSRKETETPTTANVRVDRLRLEVVYLLRGERLRIGSCDFCSIFRDR